jgi:amidohydrolase
MKSQIKKIVFIVILFPVNFLYSQLSLRVPDRTIQNKMVIDQILDKNLSQWTRIYEQLHAAPELSGMEEKTSFFIASKMKTLGFQVTEHLGRFKHTSWKPYGVVGIVKNGAGPVVMIRTEMDALPLMEKTNLAYASHVKIHPDSGQDICVMHACGHDIHMTIFLGVAEILMHEKSSWHGTLMMVAQPAEEGGPGASGAEALLEDGLYSRFPKPDFVLGLHQIPSIIAGKVAVMAGYTNATSRDGEIIVKGTGAHAARPQDGKDPIVISAELIMALQTIVSRENNPFHPAVFTIGSIHGGTKSNIIPDQVRLLFTLRTLDDETSDKLALAVYRISKGVAYSNGLSEDKYPEITLNKGYPSNYNNPILAQHMTAVFKKLIGDENVLAADPILSGEDFSYYSLQKTIPTLFFNIGSADSVKYNESLKTGIPLPSNHSNLMVPWPRLTIQTGIETMTGGALELFQNPCKP